MKRLYYALCPIPWVCLGLSAVWSNGTIGGVYGESAPWFNGGLWTIASSAVLATGGVVATASLPTAYRKKGLWIATSLTALPGLFDLAMFCFFSNAFRG